MKYIGVAIVGALIAMVAAAFVFSASLRYPDSWAQVSCGQPRDEILAKIPGAEEHEIKGDFWEAPCPLGFWQMQLTYDEQQRVAFKQLVLYVGTKRTFRAFHFL